MSEDLLVLSKNIERKEFKQKFAQNIKRLLKKKHITQQALAESIGIGFSTIKKYLSTDENVLPDIYHLFRMCVKLEIDPDEILLLGRVKEKTLQDFTTDELLAEIKKRTEAS